MGKEKYELYIKQIVDTMTLKGKNKMGYLVVGEKQPNSAMLQDIIEGLEKKGIMSYYVNLNDFDDEESCIATLKKAKERIKSQGHDGKIPMLIIESFDKVDQRKMEAVTILIGCQDAGINFIVSANTPMVHLVGLTQYLIRMHPSKSTYSDCYRYSKQKVLFSVENESFVDTKDGMR
ncbi:hypothetical protein CON22_17950 [Bacillus cereus]|nr:hypothetical protein CON22_17950 [Bacillus cereus]